MTSTTLVGTFASILYPALPAGLSWGIQYNLPNPGDVTLNILGTPTATATPASQTTCSGTAITNIVLSGSPIAATTYNWTRDNPIVTGIAASGSGDISGTLTNLTNIPITVTFTITPTSGTCVGASITATVTVNPTPDVNQPANQVVCNGAPTAAVTFTGSVTTPPGTVFNWTNSDPSIGLAASGAGNIASFIATNATAAPVVSTVTVTPSYSSGGGPAVPVTFSNTTPILIPAGQPGTDSGPSTPYPSNIVVSGITGAVTNVTVKLNNINHTFPRDIDVLLVGPGGQNAIIMSDIGGGSPGVTGITLTLDDAAVSPLPFSTAIVTGTFQPTNNGTGDVFNAPAPAPLGGSALSVFNGAIANGTWSLYVMDDLVGDFGNFNGGWEITVTGSATGVTCTGTPRTFTYTVNPTPTAVATPASQTRCSGVAIAPIVITGNAVAGVVYNWTRDNTGTVTGIAASGAGNISGTLTNTLNTPVTVTFTITPMANGCPGTPVTATVLVNPTPNAVAAPASQTICSGATITTIALSGNVAGAVYNWTRDNAATVTGIAASGAGNISGALTNTTTTPITVTFTITPTANGCPGTAITATVLVNPTPTAVATPASQTVCSATPITTIVITGNAVAGVVYNWTRDNTGTVTGIAASGAGDISGTLTNTTNAPITVTFTITPTANGCSGTPVTATVTVNPTPDVNQPANQVVCNGAPTAPVTFTGAVAGTVFNWTNSDPTIGLAASGTGDIASFTATNAGTTPKVATVTVTPSTVGSPIPEILYYKFDGSGITVPNLASAPPAGTATATINGAMSQGAPGLCGSGSLIASGGSGTTDYVSTGWNTSLGAGAWTISFKLANVNTATGSALYLFGDPAAGSFRCFHNGIAGPGNLVLRGPVNDVQINGAAVAAAHTSTFVYDPVVGNIKAYLDGVLSNTVAQGAVNISGTDFRVGTWGTSAGFLAGGQMDEFKIFNRALSPAEVSTLVSCSGGTTCTGPSKTFTYTVNPTPNATATPAAQTICSGSAITTIVNSGTVPGTVFNWTRDNPIVTGIAASGAGDISGTLTNLTNTPITVTFTITPSYTNAGVTCTGTPITATVLINPIPDVNQPANQVVCNGAPTAPVIFTGSVTAPPGTVFNWVNSDPSIGLAASGVGNIASFNAINAGTAPVTATVTVTPSYTNGGGGPGSATFNFTGGMQTFTVPAGVTSINITALGAQGGTGAIGGNSVLGGAGGLGASATGTLAVVPGQVLNIFVGGQGASPAGGFNGGANGGSVNAGGGGGASDVRAGGVGVANRVITAGGGGGGGRGGCHEGGGTGGIGGDGGIGGGGVGQNGNNSAQSSGVAGGGFGGNAASVQGALGAAGIGCAGFLGQPGVATATEIGGVGGGGQACCCSSQPSVVGGGGGGGGQLGGGGGGGGSAGTTGCAGNSKGAGGGGGGGSSYTGGVTAGVTTAGVQSGNGQVVITYIAGTVCTGTPTSFTITVNPTPTVTVPANAFVCNGDVQTTGTYNFSTTATGGVTTYSWTNNDISIGLGASGSGNSLPTFTATNTTNVPITGTITVTPTFTNGGVSCVGTPSSFSITVNPTPNAVATPASQSICNGTAITTIVLTGNVSGTVFNWTRNNGTLLGGPVFGIATSGTGDISGTLTNATNAPVTVTFTITPSYTNGGVTCLGPSITATVIVNPTPNAVALPANQTICSATPITPIVITGNVVGTVFNWTRDNTVAVTGIAASGAGDISGTLTNTTFAPVTVTFTIIPTYTNGGITCTGATVLATVIVNPTPNAVATPASQTICSGNAITPVVLTGNVAATVFNWTRDNTVAVTGTIPANGVGDIIGTLVNTTNAPITVTFTITPEANGCFGAPITATVLVNPTPNAVATPASQTICSGSAITPIVLTGAVAGTTYTWTRDNLVDVLGIPASGSGTPISGTLTNAVTSTAPELVTFTIIPSANGCAGPAITATVLVNPIPNAIATPASQAVCSGIAITPIVLSSAVTGTTFTWTRDNTVTATGIAASGAGDILGTLTNTTTAPVTVTFTITPSFTNGGVTCTGPSITATVVVNPTPTAVATPASQTVCTGSPITTIVLSGTVSGTTYNWTRDNTVTVTGIPSNGSGNISGTLVNTTLAPVLVTFTITPTANGCAGAPITATVLVNPAPNAVATPSSQTICSGTAITTIVLSGSIPGTVFNWTRNNTATVSGIAASGSGDISGTLASTNPFPVTVTFTIIPTTGGCVGAPITATVLVNPTPVVTPVSNKVYCNGVTTALITFNGTPGSTYNWTNSNTGIGLAASGTGDILPFVTTNATNGPISATITVTPVLGGCPGLPVSFTITVNPTPIVNPVASQILCNGSPTAVINFTSPTTGPTGSLSFAWVNSEPSIGLAANGTGNIQSFTAVNTGLSPVTAIITVTPVYNNGGITCTGASQTFIIVVNPTPTVNPVAGQVLCAGSNTAAVNFTGSVPGTIYNWTNNNTSIGLAASGAGNIASFTAVNAGTTPQVATITVTPNYTNTITCPGTPITFTITVNPIPTVNPVANQTVCAGATVTQAFTGAVAGTVYNWTNSNTAIGLAASGTGNLNFVSTNASGAPITATITVTPSYTNAGGTCTGTPTTFTITVNPIPTVNAVLPQVLCNGSATAAVNFTGAVAGTVYSWTNSNTTIGLAASGTGNIASFTATNTTNIPQIATITVTPTYTNGGTTCTGAAITFTITVNPTPSVNTIANQTVCNGTATAAVTITGPVAGTVYSWTNNNISIGLGASGTNTIPSFTAINTGSTPVTATITITPVFTNGGISCSGPTSSFTITVNPTARVNQPADQILCNGASTTAITFSGLPPGSTYSWTNNNTAIGLAASGTGNIPSFTATNNTTAPITATITVTPSSTGCGGLPVSFTITVNPTPAVNAIANQTLCAGAATAAVTISGPVANTVYTWTNNNTTIGLGVSGIGNIPSFVTVNPTINPVTATITVTPTFTNGGISCSGPTQSFTITVNPLPNIVFINLPQRVCLTDTIVTLRSTPAGGTWSGTGVSGNTFSAAAAGVGVHRVTYTVTNQSGCSTTRFENIVVNDCKERHNVFQQAIRIWPNPNQGRFSVQFNSDVYKEFRVKIVNARGQEMAYYEFKNLVYGQILPFDLSRLAGGTYFLYVYNSKESGVFPIIIQR
ncbi:MAG: hypothetical protein IPL54_14805 [Chitinophagaceae bacterium]|nr:hypothetical protein [Chitinophagaceae bacterium]